MIKAIIFDWVGTLTENFEIPYSYSEEVLEKIKGKYKLGLVTLASQGVEKRWRDIRNSGLEKYFDCIVVQEEKSDKQYLECMEKLGVKPTETAVVDDMRVRCEIATGLGCRAYWVDKGVVGIPMQKSIDEDIIRIDSVYKLLGLFK